MQWWEHTIHDWRSYLSTVLWRILKGVHVESLDKLWYTANLSIIIFWNLHLVKCLWLIKLLEVSDRFDIHLWYLIFMSWKKTRLYGSMSLGADHGCSLLIPRIHILFHFLEQLPDMGQHLWVKNHPLRFSAAYI